MKQQKTPSDVQPMSECPTDGFCNQNPIKVCTSLRLNPMSPDPSNFEDQCRELAEVMCKAIVRSIEEIYRQHRGGTSPSLDAKLLAWKTWAKGPSTSTPGLPDCLDPAAPTNRTLGESMRPLVASTAPQGDKDAALYTNTAFRAIQQLGAGFTAYDIDDWYDD